MPALHPYLSFSNNCEEAFNFYKSAFGGEFSSFVRFKDMPMEGFESPAHELEKIMHVSLPISEGYVLMGSDTPEAMGSANPGNTVALSLSVGSKEEADSLFAKLSAGGTITMPMDNAPWGAYFGMLTDKFGFNWMVSFEQNR